MKPARLDGGPLRTKDYKGAKRFVLTCGFCELEMYGGIVPGRDTPTYVCPNCTTPNTFALVWVEEPKKSA